MQQALQRYMDEHRLHSFEGDTGVKKLEQIMHDVCGYTPGWEGTLRNFFIDNPGACQVVVEWIGQQRNIDWKDNIESLIGPEEESEVGDLQPPEEVTLAPDYDPRDYVVRGHK